MVSLVTKFFKDWSVPYPESKDGFWGEQTSTLNFCEEVSELLTPKTNI